MRAAVDQLTPLLAPGGVLLLGEIPGTKEFPTLIFELAIRALATSHRLVVGLEVPLSEPVDGSGHGAFFDRDSSLQDGRSSKSMAKLIDDLAAMPAVETVALDGPWVAPGAPVPLQHISLLEQPRDAVMAGRILEAIDRTPHSMTIVLAGSEHTRIDRPNASLGGLLSPWFPKLISLAGLTTGGEAWLLKENGGYLASPPSDESLPIGAVWTDRPGADGYHGYVNIGAITGSPPANAGI